MNTSRLKAQKKSSVALNVGIWMQTEDDLLKDAVAKHGTRWAVVATEVGTRNGDQCAKRWNENLNPELDHSPWSVVEDRLLVHIVDLYGRNWTSIANKFFEKRPPLSLKNRMSYLERRQKREDRARTSQRRGRQSPYTSVTPPPAQLPGLTGPGLTGMSDTAANIAGFMSPGLDGSRNSGKPSSPSSNTEGEKALPLHWNSSSDDLSHFLSTLATGLETKQSSPASTQQNLSQEPVQDAHVFYMPDQVDFYGMMDDSAGFGHAAGNEGPPFERNHASMPYLFDSGGCHTANSRAGSSDHSEDAAEYSLTCPLGKVKSLVQHLVDAALTVSSESDMRREVQLVLNVKLKKL